MHLYAKVSTSLEPNETKTVGPFNSAYDRGQWLYETIRTQLRALSSELGLGGEGIKIAMAVPWDSEQLQTAIEPDKFIATVRRSYQVTFDTYD